MSVRERILMLRLMEKLEKHPAYATLLGVEAAGVVERQSEESESNAPGSL